MSGPDKRTELYNLWASLPAEPQAPEHRRREERRAALAGMTVRLQYGRTESTAPLLNVSPTGIEIRSRLNLPERSLLKVRLRDDGPWHSATVVHTTGTIGAFVIGLRVDAT